MPKILRYLIMSKLLLSNVRFSVLFQQIEESTHCEETDKVSIEAAKETQPRGQLSHNKTNT